MLHDPRTEENPRMKIDVYTKTVLTVIAVCLLMLCVKSLWEPNRVAAQVTPIVQRVVIEGVDVNVPQLQKGIPVNLYGLGSASALPVSVVGTSLNIPVNIKQVGGSIPVNVLQVAGQAVGKEGVPVTSSSAKP
jgi:hypothetical protein